MRHRRARYLQQGYNGLLDRRLGRPGLKRVPVATVETVLRLYQERYFDLHVRYFTGNCARSTT